MKLKTFRIIYFLLLFQHLCGEESGIQSSSADLSRREDIASCDESRYPKKRIICFYRVEDAYRPYDLDPCLCTHIIYSYVAVRENFAFIAGKKGDLKFLRALKKHNPNLQLLVSLRPNNKRFSFESVAKRNVSTSSVRTKFARRVREFIERHGLDGVDLDWEYFRETNKYNAKRETLLNILKTLKGAFRSPGSNGEHSKEHSPYLLTLTSSKFPRDLTDYYDFANINKIVDFVNLPAFNFDTQGRTVHHPSRLHGISDMENMDSLIDLVLSLGLRQEQINVGVPAHGVLYRLSNESLTEPGSPSIPWNYNDAIISHSKICAVRDNSNWTMIREKDLTAPYIYSRDRWIGFDDEISIKLKAKYIVLRQIGGIAFWSINDDDPTGKCGYGPYPLIQTVRSVFTKPIYHINYDGKNTSDAQKYQSESETSSFVAVIEKYGNVEKVDNDANNQLKCTRYGYIRHPTDCSKFYRCIQFDEREDSIEIFQYGCPIGLVFDERYEICNWPSWSPSCVGSGEITHVSKKKFACPTYGYFQDTENCEYFYYCSDFGKTVLQAYEFKCPFQLGFDEEKLLCNWKWLVKGCGDVVPGDPHTVNSLTKSILAQTELNYATQGSNEFRKRSDTGENVEYVMPMAVENNQRQENVRSIRDHVTDLVGSVGNKIKSLLWKNPQSEPRADAFDMLMPDMSGVNGWLNPMNPYNMKTPLSIRDFSKPIRNHPISMSSGRAPQIEPFISIPIVQFKSPQNKHNNRNRNRLSTRRPTKERPSQNKIHFPPKDIPNLSQPIAKQSKWLPDMIPVPIITVREKHINRIPSDPSSKQRNRGHFRNNNNNNNNKRGNAENGFNMPKIPTTVPQFPMHSKPKQNINEGLRQKGHRPTERPLIFDSAEHFSYTVHSQKPHDLFEKYQNSQNRGKTESKTTPKPRMNHQQKNVKNNYDFYGRPIRDPNEGTLKTQPSRQPSRPFDIGPYGLNPFGTDPINHYDVFGSDQKNEHIYAPKSPNNDKFFLESGSERYKHQQKPHENIRQKPAQNSYQSSNQDFDHSQRPSQSKQPLTILSQWEQQRENIPQHSHQSPNKLTSNYPQLPHSKAQPSTEKPQQYQYHWQNHQKQEKPKVQYLNHNVSSDGTANIGEVKPQIALNSKENYSPKIVSQTYSQPSYSSQYNTQQQLPILPYPGKNKEYDQTQVKPSASNGASGYSTVYEHSFTTAMPSLKNEAKKSQFLIIPVLDDHTDGSKFTDVERLTKKYPQLFPDDLINTKISTVSYHTSAPNYDIKHQPLTESHIGSETNDNKTDYIMIVANDDHKIYGKKNGTSIEQIALRELLRKTEGKLYSLETANSQTLVALVPNKNDYRLTTPKSEEPIVYESLRNEDAHSKKPPVVLKLEVPETNADLFKNIVKKFKEGLSSSSYYQGNEDKYEVSDSVPSSDSKISSELYDSIQKMIAEQIWGQRNSATTNSTVKSQMSTQETNEKEISVSTSEKSTNPPVGTSTQEGAIMEHLPVYNGHYRQPNETYPSWPYQMPWYNQIPYPPYYPQPVYPQSAQISNFTYQHYPNYPYQPQPPNYHPQFLNANLTSQLHEWYGTKSSTEENSRVENHQIYEQQNKKPENPTTVVYQTSGATQHITTTAQPESIKDIDEMTDDHLIHNYKPQDIVRYHSPQKSESPQVQVYIVQTSKEQETKVKEQRENPEVKVIVIGANDEDQKKNYYQHTNHRTHIDEYPYESQRRETKQSYPIYEHPQYYKYDSQYYNTPADESIQKFSSIDDDDYYYKDLEYEDEPNADAYASAEEIREQKQHYHHYLPATKVQSLQTLYNSNGYSSLHNFTDKSIPESACTRPGLFQHPNECNKYYECYWDKYINKFTLHSFDCPVKLAFDSRIIGCNAPNDPTVCVQY